MTLRSLKRAVQDGTRALSPGEKVSARTEFQVERLTAAVTAAQVYLQGTVDTKGLAETLGVTAERAAQILRTGISYMREAGWLRPARRPSSQPSSPP